MVAGPSDKEDELYIIPILLVRTCYIPAIN